jgi:hypothetical protein
LKRLFKQDGLITLLRSHPCNVSPSPFICFTTFLIQSILDMEKRSTESINYPNSVQPRFSYFPGPISNTKPMREVSLLEIYNYIKSDAFASKTNTLRAITDPKKAKAFKKYNFSYVTFSGIFSIRSNESIIKHSGLLTVDLDHVKDVLGLKEYLLIDKYFETQLLFISPSGNGLKWIIPIDPSVKSHCKYFDAVSKYVLATYNHKVDPTGREVARACFLPQDLDVYINPRYI